MSHHLVLRSAGLTVSRYLYVVERCLEHILRLLGLLFASPSAWVSTVMELNMVLAL